MTHDTSSVPGAEQGALEERIAHLERALGDVSDMVARQDTEIARMAARMSMLMRREAERDYDGGGSVPLADKPPPHW